MAPKTSNLLFLLPMPLTTAQKKKLVGYLNTALLTLTMNEIVEQELDRIYSWPSLPNSRTKRLYKNYALIYSRTELKNLLLLTYNEALGITPPDPVESDVPTAEDDTIETLINTPISGDLSTSDTPSADGGNVWSLVTNAVNGIVILNPDGSYTYTPNADFIGTDSFEYQLCDADGDCLTATITITVTAVSPIPVDNVPIAVGGTNTTIMDTPVSGDLSLNDTPSADGGNEWSLVENASDGTVLINPDGTYTYTPASGFVGEDRFIYQVCDADGDCSTAIVIVKVAESSEDLANFTDITNTWNPPIESLNESDAESIDYDPGGGENDKEGGLLSEVLGDWGPSDMSDIIGDLVGAGETFDANDYARGEYTQGEDVLWDLWDMWDDPFDGGEDSSS